MNTCPLTLALTVEKNGLHPRDEYLHVIVVTRGALSVQWDNHSLLVPAGSLVAGRGPWSVPRRAETSQWVVLGFHPGVVNDGWADLPPVGGPRGEASAMDYWLIEPLVDAEPLALTPAPDALSSLVGSIEGARQAVEVQTSPFWRCFARGHLFDLLQALRRGLEAGKAETSALPAPPSAWAAQRLLYLHAELAHQPTLAQAAHQAGMNRDAFSRRIRAETGQTFHELLTDLRLRKAEWLVRETRLPVARVAEEVGLRDQTHFTRLFKSHYAVTPSRYRSGQPGRKAEGF